LTSDTWINQLYYEEHRALGSRWPAFSRIGGALDDHPEKASLLGAFAERRQSMHFTGDTCSTWELLKFAGEFTVAEGSIGLPYVSHDIGSFHGELLDGLECEPLAGSNPRLSDEMYIRWIQFGTFQPIDRLHSNHGDRLPWEYPGEAETIASKFLRLRGRLVPHLYTLSREAHDTGLPMARALYLQWPEHDAAYDYPSQFTLGDNLLVGTVAAPGENPTVEMWIPPGTWYPYFSGSPVTGPQVLSVEVPLDEYAVFARAGSILPTQDNLRTSSRGPQDNLTLTVWAGADGSYELYEDEGVGFDYERGAFQTTEVTTVNQGDSCQTVTIAAAEGSDFPGALENRSWTVEVIGLGEPGEVRIDGELLTPGDAAPGWSYDSASDRVSVETGVVGTDQPISLTIGTECD
jgi:alpha-glucosidase (family GH31 glycosyl hydrolase)